jgi:UDP-N-acetylmuramate dehydrogenase
VELHHEYSLKLLNSFGFDSKAQAFVQVKDVAELQQAIALARSKSWSWNVLGGGTNLVLGNYLPGLTLQIQMMGKRIVSESASHVFVDIGAGENWHQVVKWTLERSLPGLENLALIPGTCGAAPIQNIGAYGSEVAHFIDSVEVFDLRDGKNLLHRLSRTDCQLTYRHSIFKKYPNDMIVTSVRFTLPKKWQPNLQYAELARYLESSAEPTAIDIFAAVCAIRKQKLPDPNVLGNAGSFFHNPMVNLETYTRLKNQFPNIVAYPQQGELPTYKIAAGWLIDQLGLKGYRQGQVGVYAQQALVLVNHGGGSGEQLLALAQFIKEKIHAVYGVDLIQEPVNLPQ